MSAWIEKHQSIWKNKTSLRYYYEKEIFDRIIESFPNKEKILEIGSGPLFFARYCPRIISSDITCSKGLNICTDAQQQPFADNTFSAIACVDVLHHIAKPKAFLQEAERILKPEGRLVLVEPWPGSLSKLFYMFIHHEECKRTKDVFNNAFEDEKDAMDGNAMIPKQLFEDEEELQRHINLKLLSLQPFGVLSYLLTGGFQKWAMPVKVIKLLIYLEKFIPKIIMKAIATRTLIVLEKK